jgi:phenylpropionate dioxygenase-like ring-hydroxylating dioxygenase large terminal subunit
MFARNCWYVAGWEQDFTEDRLHAVRIAGEPLVVYRKTDGALVALEDRCRHRFAPLSLGCREGDDLRCMYHGLKYAPSGRCIEIPGQDRIPEIARVRSFPILSRHSWVWVWIGGPDRADSALIPRAVGYDDGRYCLRHGQLDYAAPYHLINDNLLDFSHLSYVHRASFGAGPEFAYERPTVTRLTRGVRISRWLPNRPAARFSANADAPPSDHYSTYDFLVPGILLMYSANFPAGTAAALEYGAPDRDRATHATFTSQAVTPLTADTSRYFFSWGPTSGAGADALAESMLRIALQAFNEDKAMIEAQFRVMQSAPHPPVMPTTADKPVLMFQRIMRSMMAGDDSSAHPGAQPAEELSTA